MTREEFEVRMDRRKPIFDHLIEREGMLQARYLVTVQALAGIPADAKVCREVVEWWERNYSEVN